MARALVVIVAMVASRPVFADELGSSARGRTWWTSSAPEVTPSFVVSRHGHLFVDDWQTSIAGVEIDHDRFYRLIGRPDLARERELRIGLGALAIASGLAAGVLGTRIFLHGHEGAGLALVGAGTAASFTGAYVVLTPDPISASQAQDLAARAAIVGYAGRF